MSDIKQNIEKKKIITSLNGILELTYEYNMLVLNIKENCTSESFNDEFKSLGINDLFVKKRHLIGDVLMIKKGQTFIFEFKDLKYIISVSKDEIKLSEIRSIDNLKHETFVRFNKDKYLISYYVNSSAGTVNSYTYPCYGCSKKDKSILYNKTWELLNGLSDFGNTRNILPNFDELYGIFNMIPAHEYFPVISDNHISLSWKYKFDAVDINEENEATFDIVLNDTKEIIGKITFDYFNNEGFSYVGNVSCEINREFRNNGYATGALSLLKKLLKENKFKGDKTLYLSARLDNYPSHKVIENNGGELFYEGDVPYRDPINCIEGIKKVRVYKIDILKDADN